MHKSKNQILFFLNENTESIQEKDFNNTPDRNPDGWKYQTGQ